MITTLALSLIGSLAVVSACVAGITLWLQTRPSKIPDVKELETAVIQLRLQLNDMLEKFEAQNRRERVRRLRESKEDVPQEVAPSSPDEVRMALRRKVFAHFPQ